MDIQATTAPDYQLRTPGSEPSTTVRDRAIGEQAERNTGSTSGSLRQRPQVSMSPIARYVTAGIETGSDESQSSSGSISILA